MIKEKKINKINLPLLAVLAVMAFMASCFNQFDGASDKTPLQEGMSRVEITIAGADARTLLPDNSGIANMALEYKLTITKDGADTPAVNVTFNRNNWTGELEAGDYTAEIIAVKSSTSQIVAQGNEKFKINSNSTSSISVKLAHSQQGIGVFSYTVNIAGGVTITSGGIQFVSLSGNPNPASVILTSGNLSGNVNIPSGYYRVNLCLVDITGGVKMYETTAAAQIADALTTTAVYHVTANDFNRRDDVVISSEMLNAKLAEIAAKPAGEYVINVAGVFQVDDPIELNTGFQNRTIILRGAGIAEITRIIFIITGAPALVVENVTLRGRNSSASNVSPVVRVYSGCKLVLKNGARITGNTINRTGGYNGAGVYVYGGTLEIAGGEISGNSIVINTNTAGSVYGGGVFVNYDGTLLMTGGVVKENRVISNNQSVIGGGGVYLNDSSFEMTGGVIEGNVVQGASAYGGGVYMDINVSNRSFSFSGGKIRNNACYAENQADGGGVYFSGSTAANVNFSMSGGVISGNNCVRTVSSSYGARGGGVYRNQGLFLKTGGIIYGNDVTGNDADGIPLQNMHNSSSASCGHAVDANSSGLFRNLTAWENNNLDTRVISHNINNYDKDWGGFHGNFLYVAYNANGGTGTMPTSTHPLMMGSTPLTANAFSRSGYAFAGWSYTPDGNAQLSDKAGIDFYYRASAGDTVTLYAVWVPED